MSQSNFQKAFGQLHGIEGDYANNPDDRGGATRFGITLETARDWGYEGPMDELPLEVAMDIYEERYWNRAYLEKIAELNYNLAYEIFEAGVNCGVRSVGRWTQRVINLMNKQEGLYDDINVDGRIGPNTYQAIQNISYVQFGIKILTVMVNVLQGMRYVHLGEEDPTQEKFFWGWAKRVILGDNYGF